MPITDTSGQIDATFAVVARGIDWAVDNGAQVINLSPIELEMPISSFEIPPLLSSLPPPA